MKPLHAVLQEYMDAAAFSQADFAVWLGVTRQRARSWLVRKSEPHPLFHKDLKERLNLLRRTLRSGNMGLPVPVTVKMYDRHKYVQQVLDAALTKFSGENPAGRRGKVLDGHK